MNVLFFLLKKSFCLLFLGISTLNITQAQTLIIKGDSLAYDIGRQVQVLYDTEGKLTIADILLPTQQARFKRENNLKKEVKQHWYKIEIDNQTNKPFFYLDIYNDLHSELYVLQDERMTRFANGAQTPLRERAYLGDLSLYPLQVGKGKTTLYLAYRYLNDCTECLGKKYFWLHDPQDVYKNASNNSLLNFTILSVLLALAIYNVFIYFLVKDESYLYYVVSVLLIAGFIYFRDIVRGTWFTPETIIYFKLSGITANALVGVGTIFFIYFSQSYLNTRLAYPRWHKYLRVLAYALMFSTVLITIGLSLTDYSRLFAEITLLINNVIIGILVTSLLVLSIQAWKKYNLVGKYYAYSNAIFFVCVVIYMLGLNDIRLYDHTFLTYHSLKIGIAIQMMSFAVALAGKINLLRQEITNKKIENERLEKEKAIEIQALTAQKNIELEQKVKERTAELEKSNEEIRAQSEQIEQQARLLDDQKNRQLMEKTLQILQKNEILPEVGKFLESLNTQLEGEVKKESKAWQKKLSQNVTSDAHWENLKAHFEEVHPTLFAKLYEVCPDLSATDLRYCAYQKMGLSKKEIATLLHLDPESVRKHQYRIKQKLKLDENTSFTDFILRIH